MQNRDESNTCVVSILMLSYNHEKYIAQAIRSVLMQQCDFEYELVIGDDNSTDSTLEICKAFQRQHPRIIRILENEKNLGLQQNFIRTYNECKGKYIAICEGDDYWISKHKLKRQVGILQRHPEYAMCFHRVLNYFQKDGSKSLSNGSQKKITNILDLASSNYITNVSIMFRRGLFGELPSWFSEVSTYDYAVHLLNAQYGDIYYSKKIMSLYRIHDNGIWSDSGVEKRQLIALKIRELLMEYFKDNEPVFQRLKTAWFNISAVLYHHYKSTDNKNVDLITRKVRNYCPENLALLDEDLPQRSKPFVRKILTFCRANISKLIPLPSV